MSTRRARIKAIATLPQRRKNANNVETKKAQDVALNEIKSPKVSRRPSVDEVKTSPAARLNISSPRRSPRVVRGTPEPDKSITVQKSSVPAPISVEKNTLHRSDVFLSPRVPSSPKLRSPISRTPVVEVDSDVFLSPRVPSSPKLRSPISRTPVVEVDVGAEKLLTPHKRLLELQEEATKFEKLPDNDSVESPKRDNVIVASRKPTDTKIVDGYNSPNTPEPDVMDGIVPLKQVSKAPKPIDLLKSEIISENAEVVFDPIVPLPSPTKMRPKLRPVPRLGPIGPIRRNSIPGSASESEDESRRGHHGPSTPVPARLRHDSQSSHSTLHSLPNRDVARVRNDSACSMVSQGAPQTPALLGSPVKEKTVSKSRRQEVSRRMAALRRRKESIQRDKLTMYDLIFYNPLSNPIVHDDDEVDDSRSKKDEEDNAKPDESNTSSNTAAPVPQIKLGPNGEIVLDEQSLVIKQSERELSKSVVIDNAWSASGRVYRKTPRTADWSDAETVRFYRALAAMGTDFSLMEGLFPGRTRRDLKLKFKKEEKTNMAQIDKALRSVSGWDMARLLEEFTRERTLDAELAAREKERLQREKEAERDKNRQLRELKLRRSKGSIALGTSNLPIRVNCVTADDVIELALQKRKTKKKTKDFALLTPINKTTKPPPIEKVATPPLKMVTPTLKVAIPTVPIPRQTPTMPKPPQSPVVFNPMPVVPANIAPGSLVVLTIDDPKAPTKKAIHTYIKQGDGSITSIALNSNVMSSLVSLVKKDTPKGSSMSTPSPGTSSRNSTPTYPSPNKRLRHATYDIMDL